MRFSNLVLPLALLAATIGVSAPQEVIHAGDQLSVQVFGQQSLSQNVTVLPDGSVTYPLIGRITVAGESVDAATAQLTSRLSKYVRHPYVTISIAQLGQPSVLVLGNVKTPGKYQLRADARVTDAIAAAGGIADVNGSLPVARISNPAGKITNVSLQKLLHDGDVALDKPLGEGDVVYVPGPTMIDVVVTGAVDHPGDIQVAKGDRLSMAIAKAGNSAQSNADLNHIRVIHNGPDGTSHEQTINLYDALEHGDGAADIALQKGDTIYVPQAKKKNSLFENGGLLYLLGRLLIP